MKRIICTGGGTGGHVFPGLAVIESLKDKGDFEFIWMGSKKGIEYELVTKNGIPFKGVASGKLRRYFSFQNFLDIFKIGFGFLQSFFYLLFNRPAVVFSKGGYVSVPPVMAAGLLRIPVISHESDISPGLATRLNYRWSKKVCMPYQLTADKVPAGYKHKVLVHGNPVRKDIFTGDIQDSRIPAKKPLILVLGGSMGAQEINELVFENIDELCKLGSVIHQTGKEHYTGLEHENYYQYAFLSDEYPHFLAAADVVVSRSGAGGLWELGVCGKASVLIPKQDSGTRGEQLLNAELFAENGGAEILPLAEDLQDGNRGAALISLISGFLNDSEKTAGVKKKMSSLCPADASDKIAETIIQEIR